MITIAITGGIGSGKTAVTNILEEKGYVVLDADRMAHEITAPGGKSIPYIIDHFGSEYILPNGALDRARMRELVYHHPEKLRLLEEGTTKVVEQDMKDAAADCRRRGELVVFLAIPLLFESGKTDDYNAIWVVAAPEDLRIRRVMARDGLPVQLIQKILRQQASDEERRALASDVIDNSGTLDDLYRQVDRLLTKYHIQKNL